MTDSGFAFHRNGNITYTDPRDGETYTLYAPRVGEMRELEEYSKELADSFGVDEKQERLREILESLDRGNAAIKAAEASGDAELVAQRKAEYQELQVKITAENEQVAAELRDNSKRQSLAWFLRVIQMLGSDNWPRQINGDTGLPMTDAEGRDRIDAEALPAAVRNQLLVSQVKAHWWSVPLAESPNNGAAEQATVTNILNN